MTQTLRKNQIQELSDLGINSVDVEELQEDIINERFQKEIEIIKGEIASLESRIASKKNKDLITDDDARAIQRSNRQLQELNHKLLSNQSALRDRIGLPPSRLSRREISVHLDNSAEVNEAPSVRVISSSKGFQSSKPKTQTKKRPSTSPTNAHDVTQDLSLAKESFKVIVKAPKRKRQRIDSSASYNQKLCSWKKRILQFRNLAEAHDDSNLLCSSSSSSVSLSPSLSAPNLDDSLVDPIDEIEEIEYDNKFRIPKDLWDRMFEHQKIGIAWMWKLFDQQAGGINADEMGLGKTIQTIGFLAGLQYSQLISKPVLILSPTTLLEQWASEFEKWWPMLPVFVVHRTIVLNPLPVEETLELAYRERGVVITSYGTMRQNATLFLHYEYSCAILDEGHKIRNPDTEITLLCKKLNTCHRLILTGSPIQNNLVELWSLFDFVYPHKLGSLPWFRDKIVGPIHRGRYANASKKTVLIAVKTAMELRNLISPYLLRRLKQDVEINLPTKKELVLFAPLQPEQIRLYRSFLASEMVEKARSFDRLFVLPSVSHLRKICNHPQVAEPKEFASIFRPPIPPPTSHPLQSRLNENNLEDGEIVTRDAAKEQEEEEEQEEEDISHSPCPQSYDPSSDQLVSLSGKMKILSTILPKWFQDGRRVLIFSQSIKMLNIMEALIERFQYSFLRMQGSTPARDRQASVAKFNSDPSIFAFLLSTKTGGVGLNLTGADCIVIYDPDWNPSTDIQARERAWRIGQLKPVTVYRLITKGTIEEKIYQQQIFKQLLTDEVLKDPQQRRFDFSQIHDLFTLDIDSSNGSETSEIFCETPQTTKNVTHSEDSFLHELLTSGVHSALSHDSILGLEMDQSSLRRNAGCDIGAAHLESDITVGDIFDEMRKEEVQLNMSLALNDPTWTGTNGKRFGKANRSLISTTTSPPTRPCFATALSQSSDQNQGETGTKGANLLFGRASNGLLNKRPSSGLDATSSPALRSNDILSRYQTEIVVKEPILPPSLEAIVTQRVAKEFLGKPSLSSPELVRLLKDLQPASQVSKILRRIARFNKSESSWTLISSERERCRM